MAGLKLKVFPCGSLLANNYLIFSEENRKAFIIDLSSACGDLFAFLKEKKIKVEFVALTHAHFDHIEGLSEVDFPFYLHREDFQIFFDPAKNGSALFCDLSQVEKEPTAYSGSLDFEGNKIEIIHTPGHTPGSVSLKLDNWLFTGDTLFYQSIGRTDIPLASGQLILKSIKEKLLTLPKETLVYPGHGPSSSLAYEKENNPFLAA